MAKSDIYGCDKCQLTQCMRIAAMHYKPPCAELADQNSNSLQQLKAEIAKAVGAVRGLCNQYQVSDEAMEAIVQRLRQLSAI